ncbi:E3 ubiquitin-protein ligase TRIM7-like [Eublepharis macularius]|uniref:E3 ubiquitin-protein ligase TRIM7-like n=1 Tax=Eublepharis macularius TaxID=481883 RepID=A0AA97KVC5_EUBMA|nr:E3 ubiquitin-protein ligase TRIM7-like [Eublepharis macularius]
MAAGGPVQDLCEEATCSICLEYFRDPVTIAECGHNFCRACLARSWGESGAEASCPQCRGTAQPGDLRPNLQLANVVEIAKKLRDEEAGEAEGAERTGGVCEKHREPLELFCKDDEAPLCVVCGRSKEHRDHEVIPLEEASQENKTMVAAEKEGICKKHQEPLKLFCKNDESLICVECDRSMEHKYHEVIPTEEASQEYKEEMTSYLEILRKEKKKMMGYKADVMKESQDLFKQTKAERQKTVAKFKQLHKFLEEQEKLLLAQMDEVEKEVARKRDELVVQLSEEIASFESIIQEMERKCQQLDSEFLQDIRSTLQRYEEKEKSEEPVVLPPALKWIVWDFCDINPFLEGVIKKFKDTVTIGLQQQKANITLDPDTAYPQLIVSEDHKSVKWGNKYQDLPNSPKRFRELFFVLGWEGFTAGRHFWEVSVRNDGEEKWAVGVARKSVNRKANITVTPEEGIWAMRNTPDYYRALDFSSTRIYYSTLKRIRVCLNYEGGRVAFFDAETATPLYAFSAASFSGETLHPFFWVCKSSHLVLSSYCD